MHGLLQSELGSSAVRCYRIGKLMEGYFDGEQFRSDQF